MQTIIQTPTNEVDNSLFFYSRLDFKILSIENPVLVSDGKVLIEINQDRFARAGVKLLRPSWSDLIPELEKMTTLHQIEEGYLLSDPSGTWIYLIETDAEESYDLSDINASVLGNCAGISLETTAMDQSMKLWEILGFQKTMGSVEQGWITLENADGIGVSLMNPNSCPHLFFNPSLTYFNGKENNPIIIDKIRELEIPITEEVTAFNKEGIVDNVILRDPGGFGFFIFND